MSPSSELLQTTRCYDSRFQTKKDSHKGTPRQAFSFRKCHASSLKTKALKQIHQLTPKFCTTRMTRKFLDFFYRSLFVKTKRMETKMFFCGTGVQPQDEQPITCNPSLRAVMREIVTCRLRKIITCRQEVHAAHFLSRDAVIPVPRGVKAVFVTR